jgi:hypothetical protein
VRTWNGSAWGDALDLDSQGLATGTINNSAIPAAASDGLIQSGSIAPRTFGEMQLDLDFIFDEGVCASFGSAFVKSRSSDSFTSQLKDFIRPVPVDIQNCGSVVIHKVTDPAGNVTDFGYTKAFNTDPDSPNTFTLNGAAGTDTKTYDKTVLFGSGYTVTEDSPLPAGWTFVSLDCSASSGVTPNVVGQTVTFDINAATDKLECTYTNRLSQGAIEITKTRKHAADGPGSHPHPDVSFTVNGVTKTTGTNGKVCFDGLEFAAGGTSYNVTETVPAGYHADGATTKAVLVNNNAKCSDSPYVGETVAFGNTPLTNVTVSVDSQIVGGTDSEIDCGTDGTASTDDVTGDGSLTINDLEPTDPVVTVTCTITVDP